MPLYRMYLLREGEERTWKELGRIEATDPRDALSKAASGPTVRTSPTEGRVLVVADRYVTEATVQQVTTMQFKIETGGEA